MAVTRSPWALQAPAGEVVRRQSAPASAPPGYFADISSCVKGERHFRNNVHAMNNPRAGVAHTNAGGSDEMKSISTDQVPRETSIKVPTAQLLATNGSAPHQRTTFSHTPASAKRVEGGGGKRDRGTGRRTNAETTYDTDADSTRDPAQETVPRARNFPNTLQVIIGRQSLLAVPIHVVEHVSKKTPNRQ